VVLHARDARRGELVVACNKAARQLGVRQEMPLAEAAALLVGWAMPTSTTEKLVHPTASVGTAHPTALVGTAHPTAPLIEPHDLAADLAALARLAEHCERFSPLVGWRTADGAREGSRFKVQGSKFGEGAGAAWNLELGTWNYPSPACLFLDITGIGVLFGGEDKLAAELVADLARLGYSGQAAIADTLGAAWAGQSCKLQVAGCKLQVAGSKSEEIAASTLNLELGTWNLEPGTPSACPPKRSTC
jgi:hypothetical protein